MPLESLPLEDYLLAVCFFLASVLIKGEGVGGGGEGHQAVT